jgi:hypothetical protein
MAGLDIDGLGIAILRSPDAAHQCCDEYRCRVAGFLDGGLPGGLSSHEHEKSIRILIRYADLQVARVALWLEGPVDLLAYVTRNLLEWSLWCRLAGAAPNNIDVLINDCKADVVDVIRFNPMFDPVLYSSVFSIRANTVPQTAALERLWEATSNLLQVFEDDNGRLPKTTQLAKLRNEHEDWVFKECSKLLHPTAMSMLMLPNATEASLEQRRVFFRSVALHFADVGLDALLAIPT